MTATILITGCPTPADREAALAAGVVSYLPKPFSEQVLLDDVASALDRSARQPRCANASTQRGAFS